MADQLFCDGGAGAGAGIGYSRKLMGEEGTLRESCRKQRVSLSRAVFMWTLFQDWQTISTDESETVRIDENNFTINCSMKRCILYRESCKKLSFTVKGRVYVGTISGLVDKIH